jgi:hypothetical protein
MISLFTEEEFNQAKLYNKLPCQCKQCGKTFYITKKRVKDIRNPNKLDVGIFCSKKCHNLSRRKLNIFSCANCGQKVEQRPCETAASKSDRHFCSKSCAATYNNTHKKFGYRRSKLEKYLEEELSIIYPTLEVYYCHKDAINSELDIYIPSFKLAFEMNGIFHYEPIFGAEQLNKIQNNDSRKFQACIERGIEMCTIDVSSFGYFKKDRAKKYLDIITNIINIRMSKNKMAEEG